jgi:hypothetical protein
MTIRQMTRIAAVAIGLLLPSTAAAAATHHTPSIGKPDTESSGSVAWFEGRQIDLGKGWGAATACAVTPTSTRCFRNEAQMDKFLGFDASSGPAADAPVAFGFTRSARTCSSSLRLYDGTSYTGTVLSVAIQWQVLNLYKYGFDNRTSSYRIGACGADFYSGDSTSGSLYGGATWAGASASSMGTWNNILSSVYIF